MKKSNSLKWLIICAGVIILCLFLVFVLKIPFGNLLYIAAILACPLMHILMMKKGKHDH